MNSVFEQIQTQVEARTYQVNGAKVITPCEVSNILNEISQEYNDGWIPITEGCKLPADGVDVQVTIEEDIGEDSKRYYSTTAWLQDNGSRWVFTSRNSSRVVAWKHLASTWTPPVTDKVYRVCELSRSVCTAPDCKGCSVTERMICKACEHRNLYPECPGTSQKFGSEIRDEETISGYPSDNIVVCDGYKRGFDAQPEHQFK